MPQNNTTSLKVPKLRFREFGGEWSSDSINSLSSVSLANGVFNDPRKVGSGFKLINVKDMYAGYIINTNNLTLLELDKKDFERNKVLNGDIFFTRSSLVKEGIAYPNIYLGNSDIVTYDGHLIRLRLNNTRVLPTFAIYNLRTNSSRVQFISKGKTTTMTTIGQDEIGSIKIGFPSIPEQQKIASFLSLADEKIEKLKNKKSLIEKYKKGVMQKIFSQEIRFKDENSEEYGAWEEKQLGKFCQTFAGGTPRSTNKNYYYGEIPFIKSGEIDCNNTEQFLSEEGFKNSSAKLIKKGDLLYALYGATSGKVAISKLDGAINQAVLCIRTTENIYFLYSILNFKKDSLLDFYIQGGQGNLSAEIVKSFQFPIPPLPEQQKIASFLSEIDTKIESLSSEIERAEKWKKGLLQGMFV